MYVTGTVDVGDAERRRARPRPSRPGRARPCRPSSSRRPGRAGSTRCAVGGEDVGALGHEVHAAEHDVLGVGPGRRLAGQLERVAGHVGELDDLVALVVVAEHEHPVAERRLRGRGARPTRSGSLGGGSSPGQSTPRLGRRVAAPAEQQQGGGGVDGFGPGRRHASMVPRGAARTAVRATVSWHTRAGMRVLICPDKFAGTLSRRRGGRGDRRGLARGRARRRAGHAGRWPTAAPASSRCSAGALGGPPRAGADRRPARPAGAAARSCSPATDGVRRERPGLRPAPARPRPSATRRSPPRTAWACCWPPRWRPAPAGSWSGWAARPPTTAAPGCWPRSAPPRSTRPATPLPYGGAALAAVRRARRRAPAARRRAGRRDRRGQPADRPARRQRRLRPAEGRHPRGRAAARRRAGALRRRPGTRPARLPARAGRAARRRRGRRARRGDPRARRPVRVGHRPGPRG